MKKIILLSFFLIASFSVFAGVNETLNALEAKSVKVKEGPVSSGSGLHALGLFTGFLDERLKHDKDNRGMTLLASLGFDARPFFAKFGIKTAGRLDFNIEPFFNTMVNPSSEMEAGSNFLVEYAFPLHPRIQPYLKGGLGFIYMTQDTAEQSTQWNFLPQGSIGLHLYFKDNAAFSCEYRHRHLSNASIKSPNKGIDAKMYLGGLTFFFD